MCRRTCGTRQNSSANAQSEGTGKTHLRCLETSRGSQTTKRSHPAVPIAHRRVPKASRSSASAIRARYVQIGHQEVQEGSRRRRESPRAIGTAQTLSTALNTMGYVPAATGTSASSKRTRRVQIVGREAMWASWWHREASRAIRGTGMMAKASDTMGEGVARTAQQATHAASRNDSKRGR